MNLNTFTHFSFSTPHIFSPLVNAIAALVTLSLVFAFHVSKRLDHGFDTHIILRKIKQVLSCSELNIPALIREVNKEFSLFQHQQIKYGPNTANEAYRKE